MPELPEVETIARTLAAQVRGKRIVAIEKLDWERMVETPDLASFREVLVGRSIAGVGRRAKWLLLTLDAEWTLALHLRMSGRIEIRGSEDGEDVPDQHTHLILALDDGRRLCFNDQRKFGRARLLNAAGVAALDAAYGPEPLDPAFRPGDFAALLAERRTRLKPLLLNQRIIAGPGNIYVDESLWRAWLHPLRAANSLVPEEAQRLYEALRAVLTRAIELGGSTLRDYRNGYGEHGQNQEHFSVYKRAGKACPRCGTPVERIVVAQRGTHLCPMCQPAGERQTPSAL